MSFPAQYNGAGMTEFERLELEVRGKPLTLTCELPNGKTQVISVTSGQDVAYAKSLLARKLDISYSSIQFFLGTNLMIDPLSFNDFPEIIKLADDRVTIKVLIKH
jgi:hypothetical protein